MKTVNLLPAIFLFFTLFISCSKEKIITDFNKNLIPSSVDFQLNYVSYVLFTEDNGLLIAGVSNGKATVIKTNFKFETEWTKNNYEWGNIISGSGWGSSFYSPNISKIFQKDDGKYVCFCSIEEGGDVVYSSTLLLELNPSGEQIRKVEFQDNRTTNVLQTNDGGYLLFGSKLIKLDRDYNQQWSKDLTNQIYNQYQIAPAKDGGFATTGSFNNDQVFLKKLDSNGNEISTFTYKHSDYPFEEAGFDLFQLTDNGFLIIGRTGKTFVPNVINCQIIRTSATGDTIWTKRFGGSTNNWLDHFTSQDKNEFVIQGSDGFPNEIQKSILIRINTDGLILDSIKTEKFQMMLYSPLRFYIKVQSKDQDHINFTKIESENLFN
jgi:hypothetical protein